MGIDVVDGDLKPPALQLFHDAVHGFDAVLDVVDGGMVIQAGKLLVQDLQLGDGNLQGAAVQVVHPHHALGQLLLFRRTPWGIWMSLSRMVPLFSIIMKKLRLLVIGSLIVMIITYSYDGCVNKLQNPP